jgi:hypothetical protein
MSFYSEMADMAHEMLSDFGSKRTLILTRQIPTGSDYEPGPPIDRNYTVIGVVLLHKSMVKQMDTVSVGGLIDTNRRTVMLSTFMADGRELPIEPKNGDLMTLDGKTWTVEGAAAVNPGGVAVLYKMDVVI